jgi:hypothetical protein
LSQSRADLIREVKDLLAERRKLSANPLDRMKIPKDERDFIATELVRIMEPLLKATKDRAALSTLGAKRVLHEVLAVDV